MNLESLNNELEKITRRIDDLELNEDREDRGWKISFSLNLNKVYSERAVVWNSIKNDLERRNSLVKSLLSSATDNEEKFSLASLLGKLSLQLSRTEERLAKAESVLYPRGKENRQTEPTKIPEPTPTTQPVINNNSGSGFGFFLLFIIIIVATASIVHSNRPWYKKLGEDISDYLK